MRSTTVGLALWAALLAAPLSAQSPIAVVNSASFQRGFPVAPGSIAAAFGTFAGVTEGSAQAVPLPRTINNVRVLVNNVEAPLFFVSAGQINFQVPRDTPIGTVQIRVTGGTSEVSGMMNVLPAAPGLYLADAASTLRPGAIQNENLSANSQQNRARRGQVIVLYGTGPGPTNGTQADGAAPTGDLTTARRVRAVVSVADAVVEYSGLSSVFPGLWQVNLRVPDRPFIAGQVPVFVEVDGIQTPPVSFWVAE